MPVVVFEPRESYLFMAIAWFFGFLKKYRSAHAPFWCALLAIGAAIWLHIAYPAWWPAVLALTVIIIVGIVFAPTSWAQYWPPLSRRIERAYAITVIGYAGGWLTAACALGPFSSLLLTLWFVGTPILAIPWWTHRRRREKVRMTRLIEAWPDIAVDCGVPGVRIRSVDVGEWGWTARLALPRGMTVARLVTAMPAMDSAFAVKPGSVRVEPDPAKANRAQIRVMEKDPHEQPIPYPEKTKVRSIADPIPLAVFETGETVEITVYSRHTLVAGIMGGGKSGLINSLITGMARVPAHDVIIWGIDLKAGMELGPWSSCLEYLAIDKPGAVELARRAEQEVQRRSDYLRQQGRRKWKVSKKLPALVIIIDEYAELPDEAQAAIDSVARLGRASAVSLVIATQRPTQKVMGGGAVRSQMDNRICMRVAESRETDLILGQGSHTSGWRPDTLTLPGSFLVRTPEYRIPMRARAYYVTDEDVETTAAAFGNPDHNVLSAGETNPAPTPTNDPPPANTPTIPRPRQESDSRARTATNTTRPKSECRPDGKPPQIPRQGPEADLWRALTSAPPDGVAVSDLVTLTGMSRGWVHARLNDLDSTGWIERVSRGHWRAKPSRSTIGKENT